MRPGFTASADRNHHARTDLLWILQLPMIDQRQYHHPPAIRRPRRRRKRQRHVIGLASLCRSTSNESSTLRIPEFLRPPRRVIRTLIDVPDISSLRSIVIRFPEPFAATRRSGDQARQKMATCLATSSATEMNWLQTPGVTCQDFHCRPEFCRRDSSLACLIESAPPRPVAISHHHHAAQDHPLQVRLLIGHIDFDDIPRRRPTRRLRWTIHPRRNAPCNPEWLLQLRAFHGTSADGFLSAAYKMGCVVRLRGHTHR